MKFVKEQGVVGIAVGLTVGLAAVEMVNRVLGALVTPLIERVAGGTDITEVLAVDIGEGQTLMFGDALDAVIQFLIIAFVVYLIVTKTAVSKMASKK